MKADGGARKTALLWGDGPASRIPSLSLASLRGRP